MKPVNVVPVACGTGILSHIHITVWASKP